MVAGLVECVCPGGFGEWSDAVDGRVQRAVVQHVERSGEVARGAGSRGGAASRRGRGRAGGEVERSGEVARVSYFGASDPHLRDVQAADIDGHVSCPGAPQDTTRPTSTARKRRLGRIPAGGWGTPRSPLRARRLGS
jgi:hypothetical protein